jgi:hypothetical protein
VASRSTGWPYSMRGPSARLVSGRGLTPEDARDGEWPLRFWWLGSHPFDGPVHSGSPDAEEFGELTLGVGAKVVQLQQVLGLVGFSFGCLPRSRPLAFATYRADAGRRACQVLH